MAIESMLPITPADKGEDEVHRADVFVIGRVDPSPPAMRTLVVGGFCLGATKCHDLLLAFT